MVACQRHRICDTGPSNTVAEEVGELIRVKFIDASSWQEQPHHAMVPKKQRLQGVLGWLSKNCENGHELLSSLVGGSVEAAVALTWQVCSEGYKTVSEGYKTVLLEQAQLVLQGKRRWLSREALEAYSPDQ